MPLPRASCRRRLLLVASLMVIIIVAPLAGAQDAGTPPPPAPGSAPAVVVVAPPANAGNSSSTNAAAAVASSPSPPSPSTSPSPPSAAANTSSPPPVKVDHALPHFRGVRSCLPFNVLIAAPQRPAPGSSGNSSTMTTSGRITITADPAVINATGVAVEDGILVLSLTNGFFSNQPISFIVTAPLSGGELESVANHGSGMLVLGPGHNTSSLRVNAASVGQVRVINITTDTLTFSGSGVLGSILTGAFNKVFINTGAATGTVVLSSVTPVNASVNLGGITTLLVDGPAGTRILGKAAGLSKVQYTNGECILTSQTPSLFPSSSLFGPTGDIFGSNKCSKVAPSTMATSTAAAANPQWTCGVLVDGQLSCAGADVTDRQDITLTPINGTQTAAPPAGASPAPEATTGNFTTPPENFTTPPEASTASPANAASSGANTAGTGGNAAGGSSSSNAASSSPAPNAAGGSSSNAASSSPAPNAAGGSSSNAASSSPAPNAAGGSTSDAASSPVPNAAGGSSSNAASSSPAPNAAGSNPNAFTTTTPAVSPPPAETTAGGNAANTGSGSTGGQTGARRLLERFTAGRRRLQQQDFFSSFPSIPMTTTFTPSGTLSTGTFTSGPGASASSSSSTSGSGGTAFQSSTSQGGSAPSTVFGGDSFFNPVVIPSVSANSPSPSPAVSPSPSPSSPESPPAESAPAESPSPSPAAANPSEASSVSISTGGGETASGIAVVNTQCGVNTTLNMLQILQELPPTQRTDVPSPINNATAQPPSNATVGLWNAAGTGNAADAGPAGNAATSGPANTAGNAATNGAANTAASSPAPNAGGA